MHTQLNHAITKLKGDNFTFKNLTEYSSYQWWFKILIWMDPILVLSNTIKIPLMHT
jgi:hypothetical protein